MLKNKFIICTALLGCILSLSSCGQESKIPEKPREYEGLAFEERVDTEYADKFAIDRYNGGYSVVYTPETAYLLVPEEKEAPKSIDKDIKIINKPVHNIYLAATAAMTFFDELDAGESIRFSGTQAQDWYIDYAREAMQKGDMLYAGKYREPDYELLLKEGCTMAAESTMILHSPDVKEKLEELGITVFTDYSSYENHPLGRSEWIKVYGEILDKADEAERLFGEQAKYLDALSEEPSGKTAAFFYINTNGQAVTRKPGDYITKMIELAGGENILKDTGSDSSSSTLTMEAEEFYTKAKDADFIIYNSTIGGEISTLDELLSKSAMLADFKAVKDGNVWCTHNNLYQETMKLGAVISDFNTIFSGEAENNPPKYLYKVGDSGE